MTGDPTLSGSPDTLRRDSMMANRPNQATVEADACAPDRCQRDVALLRPNRAPGATPSSERLPGDAVGRVEDHRSLRLALSPASR